MPELFGRTYPASDLLRHVGRLDQVAGVRLVTLGDGVERGVRVLEFRTGTGFVFDVVVDRAFDIGRCEHAGRSLAWSSSVGFAGPWYYEPEGLGFLRNWGGGLLATCGLDHALFMAEDTAEQYHYPAKSTEQFGLHGRVSNRPARLTGYGERWEGDDCVLWAEGEVLQASVFGEHLLLRRRIEARVGESSAADSRRGRERRLRPDAAHAALPHQRRLSRRRRGRGGARPGPPRRAARRPSCRGLHDPRRAGRRVRRAGVRARERGRAGRERARSRRQPGLGLGAYEIYRQDQLPFHFMWRMLGEGTYVVGIEPCTNRTAGRLDARERGELIELGPGEKRSYDLELGALVGAAEIDAFAARVARLTA